MDDATILRLVMSQAFLTYYLLILVPIKLPRKRNVYIIILASIIITSINAILINNLGLTFYIRYYILTLALPYIALFSYVSIYKGAKLFFAMLTVQVIANVSIINGLLASQLIYGENNPLIDTAARTVTLLIFLPIVFKFIRPTYLKMVEMLNKGWWVLNSALILSYALAYYILFVPSTIFNRPEYFTHAYIGTILSLLIYAIIFFLFIEIQSKTITEHDKQRLSIEVESLAAQSAEISSIAYLDSLTGIKNRYSLYRRMDQLIDIKQNFLVVFIDLDDLKEINDNYDHSKGDYYLKHFAHAVQNSIMDKGEAYRFAGDEFICLLTRDFTQFDSDDFKNKVAQEIVFDVPFQGFSLGLAFYPIDGLNSDDLISVADQMMYAEKRAKKNRR